MSVELTHNGERYMVDGGKWHRRLKVGEWCDGSASYLCDNSVWCSTYFFGPVSQRSDLRVPCVDPRPPFKVGDRVKVARKSGDDYTDQLVGHCGVVTCCAFEGFIDCDFDHIKAYLSIPSWCLDLIETVKSTVGQTIIERLTKNVEKTEQETAKVMKFTQWQLWPVKEPKTLADVDSSRDKPVLCWRDEWKVCQCFVEDGLVRRMSHTGIVEDLHRSFQPNDYPLYQPSTPAYTLETLPDYRVVIDKQGLWFRQSHSQWYFSVGSGFGESYLMPSADFTITPYEAYLAEVDLTGGEK